MARSKDPVAFELPDLLQALRGAGCKPEACVHSAGVEAQKVDELIDLESLQHVLNVIIAAEHYTA
jgi:hypothetical protein